MTDKKIKNLWHAQPKSEKEGSFTYTPPPTACVGPTRDKQFFMGGVAMAVAIDSVERATGKPLLWATTQFLNHGMQGDRCDIDIEHISGGRNVQQAMIVTRHEDVLLQRTIAALGRRPVDAADTQFITMPDVAPPEDCPPKKSDAFGHDYNLIGQIDRRLAYADAATGCEYSWFRIKFDHEICAPLLALISDFFLGAHKRSRGGTSLDNTLRLGTLCPTEWILCATHIANFHHGGISGTQYLFAQNGTLLASASQTGLLPYTPNP